MTEEIAKYDALVRGAANRIDLYHHLAQELAEMTAALLKYVQVLEARDPTELTEAEALDALYEETIDVLNYMRVLKFKDSDANNPLTTLKKMRRWAERLGVE